MTGQSAMNIFEFDDAPVRTLMIDDNPWFVGKDVCRVLELHNNRDALSRLDSDERRDDVGIADAIGREQKTAIINEAGVYHLAFTSRLEAAKRFRRWITHEVLPALRKTGRFEMDTRHPGDLSIRDKVNMVSEARRNHGKPAARALWTELGLPLPSAVVSEANSTVSGYMDALQEFMSECTVPDAGGRVRAFYLKQRYDQWARRNNAVMMTAKAFGKLLPQMGFDKIKTNVVFYTGFRMVEPGAGDG